MTYDIENANLGAEEDINEESLMIKESEILILLSLIYR